MSNKVVRVLEVQTRECLFECSMENMDQAYEYAATMEGLGIDVVIDSPSLPQTLAQSLGVSTFEQERLKAEINDEIEDHIPCGNCETRH